MNYMISFLLFGSAMLFSDLLVLELPKEITSDWEEKVFGIKYGVTTLDKSMEEISLLINEKGFGVDFIGKIHQEILTHSMGEGEYVEYWDNGQIKVRLPYKDGKAHGHIHGWYDNGQDAFVGYYDEGVKQGMHLTFFWSKKNHKQFESSIIFYNEKGQLDGKLMRSFINKKPAIFMSYKEGKAYGLASLTTYLNGKSNQEFNALYMNNTLEKELTFEESRKYDYPTGRQYEYARKLSQRFLSRLKKKYSIIECSEGGILNFGVEELNIYFSLVEVGTIEKAREMVIQIGEDFLHMINSDEKIRPYLRVYPFTQDRISFSIRFAGRNSPYNKKSSVDYVKKSIENEITYAVKESKRFKDLHIENYDEARKICKVPDKLEEIDSDFLEEGEEVDYQKSLRLSWMQDALGIKLDANTLSQAVMEILFVVDEEGFGDDFIDDLEKAIKENPKGEGKFVQYWKNGKMKVSLPFKDGKPDGTLKGWYDNGRRAFIGIYKNGIKQGIHRTYYKTKWFQRKRPARVICYNQEGKLDGRSEIYIPNGEKIVLTDYKNGLLNGKMSAWDSKGNEVINHTFINDEVVNPYK